MPLTCGIPRHFQAFSSLRVFPAPDPPLPCPSAGNANRSARLFRAEKVGNMVLQTVTIVILVTIISSCKPVVQHPLIPTLYPTDVIATILASTSTPTTTLTLLPTSTTTTIVHPILETALPPSPTITPNATQAAQQEDIKDVIQAYFEIRYQLLSISPPADIQQDVFGELVSSGDDPNVRHR